MDFILPWPFRVVHDAAHVTSSFDGRRGDASVSQVGRRAGWNEGMPGYDD